MLARRLRRNGTKLENTSLSTDAYIGSLSVNIYVSLLFHVPHHGRLLLKVAGCEMRGDLECVGRVFAGVYACCARPVLHHRTLHNHQLWRKCFGFAAYGNLVCIIFGQCLWYGVFFRVVAISLSFCRILMLSSSDSMMTKSFNGSDIPNPVTFRKLSFIVQILNMRSSISRGDWVS